MKKLIRSSQPTCLNNYKHGTDNWDSVTSEEKQQIWTHINEMQKGFCAYCECTIPHTKRHIEHFVPRNSNPRLTFNWNNLFGSCDNKSRCGHYKDSAKVEKYDPSHLIKPDEDDCSKYLIFITDGHIILKSELAPNEIKKAKETIRVFNLDEISLVNARKSSFKANESIIEGINDSIKSGVFTEKDWLDLYQEDLDYLSTQQFQTALKHYYLYKRAH